MRHFICYCMDDELPTMRAADIEKFTVLNLAFGLIKDGLADVSHLKNLGELARIRAANPALKIVLSVGGWSAGGFSEMAMSQAGRTAFCAACADIAQAHDLDGIDIDWEYPTHWQADIAGDPADKENFTLLLRDLRAALDTAGKAMGKHLITSIAAGADLYWNQATDMRTAHTYLDYVQLMTYDMRGGFQCLTGHHTNLYNATGDLFRLSGDSCVRDFEAAGVPRDKMILGAAFYGRRWTGVPNHHDGRFVLATSTGTGVGAWDTLLEKYIDKNGYKRFWDDEAKAPWLFNGDSFITYDDPESLAHKCAYIKERGLLGLMYWAYCEDPADIMVKTVHEALR